MTEKGPHQNPHTSRGGTAHEEKLSPGGWNLSKGVNPVNVGNPNVMRSIKYFVAFVADLCVAFQDFVT
jgi:hypothetical protein